MPRLEEVAPRHRVRCFDWHRTAPLKLEPKPVVRLSAVAGPLLAVEGLRAEHRSAGGPVVVADDVSFTIARRDCVALVGESGSGKTTIGRCVVGLHAPNAGRILLDDMPLPARAQDRPREARRRVQIVFQNPYDSLNPRHRVQDSLVWSSRQLRRLDRRAAQLEAAAMLERVRLPRATAQSYPRELSGGERQRVAIARALIAKPDLIICDEVTSALDVSVQAAVLELLAELQRDLGLAVLFITHDLGVVANIADRALVLEQGVVREQGATDSLLANPTHEYTRRLVDAAPRVREAPRVR
jgi:peptide/nickel transport system ATP-binding protein